MPTFQSRKLNAHINILNERVLLVVHGDFESYFEELLRKDSSITLHQRNLQKLMRYCKGTGKVKLE